MSSIGDFITESEMPSAESMPLALDQMEVRPPAPIRLPAEVRHQKAIRISKLILAIDTLMSDQVNAILHHPSFQKLEASWRGLQYLVSLKGANEEIIIRAVNISWRELARDVENSVEFDRSWFFDRVYTAEFDMPSELPGYGILLADFEIHPFLTRESSIDDIATLRGIAQGAAAAFSPIIIAANPMLLGLDSFQHLERDISLKKVIDSPEFSLWRSLREEEDSRFIGVVLPRVLMRQPYRRSATRKDGFRFTESTVDGKNDCFLWGTAVYAYGAVVLRAFRDTAWFTDIRGVRVTESGCEDGGGIVADLPYLGFGTDDRVWAPRPPVDVVISDELDAELAALGIISLCSCKDTSLCAFYSSVSIQKARLFDQKEANANAKMATLLHYTFCVARFAHHLKIMTRTKIGGAMEPDEIEHWLHNWIHNYVTTDRSASLETKHERPLQSAQVSVEAIPGKPGQVNCIFRLVPHHQFDEALAGVRLKFKAREADRR